MTGSKVMGFSLAGSIIPVSSRIKASPSVSARMVEPSPKKEALRAVVPLLEEVVFLEELELLLEDLLPELPDPELFRLELLPLEPESFRLELLLLEPVLFRLELLLELESFRLELLPLELESFRLELLPLELESFRLELLPLELELFRLELELFRLELFLF